MVSVPFKNSYWVIPGKFLAGFYPGSEVKEESRQKLRGLLSHGIRQVINLMEPHEINWFGKRFVHYEYEMRALATSMGYTVTCERMPIRDASAPSKAEMCAILDRIDQCINDNTPVYVHCLGGRGRTGTVVGCFLVRHGIASGDNALKLIQTLRKETADSPYPSPEFPEQYDMILSWKERQ
jgi:protein-tyrosine phosphatase